MNFIKNAVERYKRIPVERRAMYLSFLAFAVNAVNSVLNGVFGSLYGSNWMIALAVYYALLCLMRGGVIAYYFRLMADKTLPEEKKAEKRLFIYRLTGFFLLVITAVLAGMIVLLIRDGNGYYISGFLIYYFAAYTVYKLVASVRSALKARSYDDFTLRAVRNIGLADAYVSVLSLQIALLAAFGNGSYVNLANAITGGVACGFIIYLSIFMIIQSFIVKKKGGDNLFANSDRT